MAIGALTREAVEQAIAEFDRLGREAFLDTWASARRRDTCFGGTGGTTTARRRELLRWRRFDQCSWWLADLVDGSFRGSPLSSRK
jgi:hypothetical protein